MKIYNVFVPYSGPKDARILFVGEAPGESEEIEKKPFVGEAGKLLDNVLMRCGSGHDEVGLANLCCYRPVGNKFHNLLGSKELEEGLESLYSYIRTNKPTVIVALGNAPLYYLTGKGNKKKDGTLSGISKYRGSILPCSISDLEGIKVIPTYHPSYILRNRSDYPVFAFDIQKALADSLFPEFKYPTYNFTISPKGLERERVTELCCNSPKLAIDIETIYSSTKILCIGFAWSSTEAMVLQFNDENLPYIERVLTSNAKKIFHFGTFDREQLRINGQVVSNYYWDTLTAQHCLEPELPRSLEYLCSVYTRQPYYKTGRGEIPDDQKSWSLKTAENRDDLYRYNATDCVVTFAIQEQQEKELEENKNKREAFDFEMESLEVAWEIMKNGLPVDDERVELLKTALLQQWAYNQYLLNLAVGHPLNVNSHVACKKVLYTELGLPARKDGEGNLTSDEDAIVSLITFCKGKVDSLVRSDAILGWQLKINILKCILLIRGIRKLLSNYVNAKRSPDRRLRSTVKVSNVETGRWSMSKYVDDTGLNAQTFARGFVIVPEDLKFDISAMVNEALKELEKDKEEEQELAEV